MELKPVWKEQYYVGAYDVDTRGEIKLSRLTGYMQETAWYHASHLALGADFMHKERMVWMLSAIKLHIDRYPKWMEKIIIESWPKGLNRFFYLRDFILYDQLGNQFAIASTEWLLIDVKTKRPRIVETNELSAVKDLSRNVFEEPIGKLPVIEKGEMFTRSIDYTDMDLNQHLSSNRYFDIILGTFSYDFHKCKKVVDFQLNYRKEVTNVNEIVLKQMQINDQDMFIIEGLSKDLKLMHFQSFVNFNKF